MLSNVYLSNDAPGVRWVGRQAGRQAGRPRLPHYLHDAPQIGRTLEVDPSVLMGVGLRIVDKKRMWVTVWVGKV